MRDVTGFVRSICAAWAGAGALLALTCQPVLAHELVVGDDPVASVEQVTERPAEISTAAFATRSEVSLTTLFKEYHKLLAVWALQGLR